MLRGQKNISPTIVNPQTENQKMIDYSYKIISYLINDREHYLGSKDIMCEIKNIN
ncbi:hypothetical protein [Rosettibacter firmus]|uniref:hypothetical protein n=1 Tax=Rosettibacter firmus TaxID=3111522 RepID=UPI00336BC38B